jgi:hypothetical protein
MWKIVKDYVPWLLRVDVAMINFDSVFKEYMKIEEYAEHDHDWFWQTRARVRRVGEQREVLIAMFRNIYNSTKVGMIDLNIVRKIFDNKYLFKRKFVNRDNTVNDSAMSALKHHIGEDEDFPKWSQNPSVLLDTILYLSNQFLLRDLVEGLVVPQSASVDFQHAPRFPPSGNGGHPFVLAQ